jgi:large subunit ribosomal protein L9
MKVVVLNNVYWKYSVGQVVNVKPGYARNYLIPQRIAVPANQKSITNLISSSTLHHRLLIPSFLVFVRAVGSDGKLSVPVKVIDVVLLMKKFGCFLWRCQVALPKPIEELGRYSIKIYGANKAYIIIIVREEGEHVTKSYN